MRVARLFITHVWYPELEFEFRKLFTPGVDTWLLVDSGCANVEELCEEFPQCHVFDLAGLTKLPYCRIPTGSLIGHGHFPILDFFLKHPSYDYYWFVEYDVRYSGDWNTFLARYDTVDHDLITTHIRRWAEEPYWHWWKSFGPESFQLARDAWVRSFNVLYRISQPALKFLDEILRQGWYGHHEVLVATLLHSNGFRLLDFGGQGSFTDPAALDSVYTSGGSRSGYLNLLGTVRYRPSRLSVGAKKNMLYHPVKPESQRESLDQRRAEYQRWQHELQRDLAFARKVHHRQHIGAADLLSNWNAQQRVVHTHGS